MSWRRRHINRLPFFEVNILLSSTFANFYWVIASKNFHNLAKMGSISVPTMSAATKLRDMIESPGSIILGPGVYDGFSARIALGVGFNVIYMV